MINPFNYFCAQILPLVYDDTLSYYECLCKVTAKLNEVIKQSNMTAENMLSLKTYVDNYFDDLNVQLMVETAINDLIDNGTFSNILATDTTPLQTNLKTDSFVILADSYAVFPSETDNWVINFIKYARINSENVYNFAKSGSGFVKNYKWNDILNARMDEIKDKKKITKFILAGGTNDRLETQSTIIENARTLFENIRTNFPNAEIHLFGLANNLVYSIRQQDKNSLNTYALLENFGIIYHPIYNVMHFSALYHDQTHPNSTGAQLIGQLIYQHMVSNNPIVRVYAHTLSANPNKYVCLTDGLTIQCYNDFFRLTNVTANLSNYSYDTTLIEATSQYNFPVLPIPETVISYFNIPTVNTSCIGALNTDNNIDTTLFTKIYMTENYHLNLRVYGISKNYDTLMCLSTNNILQDII